MTTPHSRRVLCAIALVVLVSSLRATPVATQSAPRALQPDEYGRWEQVQSQRTPLSPDGKWLVYGIARSNRQNELRVHPSGGGPATVITFGEQPAFSEDSRWL